MVERVTLTEHAERGLKLAPGQVRPLLDLARGRLTLQPTGEPHHYCLRSTSYVGTLALPGLQVLVRPKVPLANLFTMLAVPGAREDWQDEDFAYATERRLLPAFAAFFARAADRALGRGPLRAYRVEQDRLPALRGRIDFAAQVRRPATPAPLACRYQDYTADVLENRALRAAIRRCLMLGGVPERVRGRLLHQLARLEDVADASVDPDAVDRIPITRLNRHYTPALRLAGVVLRETTLVDTPGGAGASAFLVDMNRVFEAFVTHRLRGLLRPGLDVRGQVPGHLDVSRRVGIRPDIVVERAGRAVLVGDIKYKLSDDAFGRAGDYYQLLAYATALGLPAGLLIYCHPGAGAPPRDVQVRHGSQRLWSHAVRVAGSRRDLDESIGALAELFRELVRGTPPALTYSAGTAPPPRTAPG